MSGFNTESINWIHLEGDGSVDYPIDYWVAVLGASPEQGRIDFLVKWPANTYCHYHRHVGATRSLVLEGEHHAIEMSGAQQVHKVRGPGDYAQSPAGEVHMEYSGPQGAAVLFSMQAVDGKLFEILDQDGKVLSSPTVADFQNGLRRT